MEKKRNIWFDNVKVMLLVLVVFGHVIEQIRFQDKVFLGIYNWIYLFHMPLFVFCSGAFAREGFKRVARKYLLVYVIFQFIFGTFDVYVMGAEAFHFWDSYYVLWYLLALSVWSLLLPLVRTNGNKKKQAVIITASVVIGLLAGFINWIGKGLSLSRILVFYPYFLAGYYWQQEGLSNRCAGVVSFLKKRIVSVVSAVVLVVTAVAVFIASPRINTWALYGYTSYEFQGYTVAFRMIQYVAAVMLGIAFMLIVPREKALGSTLARQMMPVYLLHVPFIKCMEKFGILDRLHNSGERMLYALTATFVIIVVCAGIAKGFSDRKG